MEAVDGDAGFADSDSAVVEKADAAEGGVAAGQEREAAAAVVVPHHRRLARLGVAAAAADEGEDVGSEHHLHGPYAAAGRVAPPELDEVPA